MQARFVILRVLLEAGEGLIAIETMKNATDGKPDLVVKLDRDKIKTVGKEAIGKFLKQIQVSQSRSSLCKHSQTLRYKLIIFISDIVLFLLVQRQFLFIFFCY